MPLQITTMRMCPLSGKALSLLHNDMLAVRIRMTAPFTFTIPGLTKWPFEDPCILWCNGKRDIISMRGLHPLEEMWEKVTPLRLFPKLLSRRNPGKEFYARNCISISYSSSTG